MITQCFGDASLLARTLRLRMPNQCHLSHVFPRHFNSASPAIAILYALGAADLTNSLPGWDMILRCHKLVSSSFAPSALRERRCDWVFLVGRIARRVPQSLRYPLGNRRDGSPQVGAVSASFSVSDAINLAFPLRCSKNHSRLRGCVLGQPPSVEACDRRSSWRWPRERR